MARPWWLAGVTLLVSLGYAGADEPRTRFAAVVGLEQPCARDGICNAAVCDSDPDCPRVPRHVPPPLPIPAEWVNTKCGGVLWVEATDSPIAVAANAVRAKYGTFNTAQKAKD